MKLLADKDIKCFFLGVICVMTAFLLLSQMAVWVQFGTFSLPLFLLFLLAACGVFAVCCRYIHKRNKILERAAAQIRSYLDGNTDARIDCDEEGELYHLFHCVNTLAAVLNAHAANENREKEFLKNAGFQPNDMLTAEISDGKIILSRGFRHRSLKERAAEYGGKLNLSEEIDWGEPMGDEVW